MTRVSHLLGEENDLRCRPGCNVDWSGGCRCGLGNATARSTHDDEERIRSRSRNRVLVVVYGRCNLSSAGSRRECLGLLGVSSCCLWVKVNSVGSESESTSLLAKFVLSLRSPTCLTLSGCERVEPANGQKAISLRVQRIQRIFGREPTLCEGSVRSLDTPHKVHRKLGPLFLPLLLRNNVNTMRRRL